MKKWFVYIIECADGSFYTGVTSDLRRRFQEHKEGRGGRYSRINKPLKIVHSELFPTKINALRREKQIKGWRREKKQKLINKA